MRMLWKKSSDLRIRHLKKTVNQRQISTDQSEIAVLQLFPTWTSMWGLFWISMQRMWTEAQHSSLSWEKNLCKKPDTEKQQTSAKFKTDGKKLPEQQIHLPSFHLRSMEQYFKIEEYWIQRQRTTWLRNSYIYADRSKQQGFVEVEELKFATARDKFIYSSEPRIMNQSQKQHQLFRS